MQRTRSLLTAPLPLMLSEFVSYTGTCRQAHRQFQLKKKAMAMDKQVAHAGHA